MGWLGWRTSRGAISAQVCSFQARRGGGGREGRIEMEAATAAEVAFTPSSAPREHSSGEKALPTTDTLCGERGRGGRGAAPRTPQQEAAVPRDERGRTCPAGDTRAEPGELRRAGPGGPKRAGLGCA